MSVPLCRSRVLYIGSAVPTITKDGLQGIQQPLLERYPATGVEVKGIDSWLSVWSNGLLLEYIEGNSKTEGSFHPIINLHYCAAVRYVDSGNERGRFVPLDSVYGHNSSHPPIFAAIFRRSSGIRVLECHAFICTNERAANALVRCCFHSYADTTLLRMEDKLPRQKAIKNGSIGERADTPNSEQQTSEQLTTDDNQDELNWDERAIGQKTWQRRAQSTEYDDMISSESSVRNKKQGKRGKKQETRSEIFENNMIIPYNEPMRRTGSHPDLSQARPFEPHFPFHLPPHMHPHHFGPPPPGFHPRGRPPHPMFMPHFGKPPMHPPFHPHSMPPPPPFFARFGRPIPPPMFMRPPMHPIFMPPPFNFYPPQPTGPAPTGPIIETIYDTYPRRGTHDESIYNATLPPNSTYKPSPRSNDYEGFYDTYRHRAKGAQSDSDTSVDDSQFWDNYESGAYKKPNSASRLNGEKSPKPQSSYVQHSTPKIDTRQKRPKTPEIDYDEKFGNIVINEKTTNTHTNRQAAVF